MNSFMSGKGVVGVFDGIVGLVGLLARLFSVQGTSRDILVLFRCSLLSLTEEVRLTLGDKDSDCYPKGSLTLLPINLDISLTIKQISILYFYCCSFTRVTLLLSFWYSLRSFKARVVKAFVVLLSTSTICSRNSSTSSLKTSLKLCCPSRISMSPLTFCASSFSANASRCSASVSLWYFVGIHSDPGILKLGDLPFPNASMTSLLACSSLMTSMKMSSGFRMAYCFFNLSFLSPQYLSLSFSSLCRRYLFSLLNWLSSSLTYLMSWLVSEEELSSSIMFSVSQMVGSTSWGRILISWGRILTSWGRILDIQIGL